MASLIQGRLSLGLSTCGGLLSSVGGRGLATVYHEAWYKESLERPEEFWGRLARERIRWIKPFNEDNVMDCSMREARFSWFEGGQLNMSGNNCIY